MSVAKVNKLMKDNGVKFVDLRFTDTRGKEQHVTLPVLLGLARVVKADVLRFVAGPLLDEGGLGQSSVCVDPSLEPPRREGRRRRLIRESDQLSTFRSDE